MEGHKLIENNHNKDTVLKDLKLDIIKSKEIDDVNIFDKNDENGKGVCVKTKEDLNLVLPTDGLAFLKNGTMLPKNIIDKDSKIYILNQNMNTRCGKTNQLETKFEENNQKNKIKEKNAYKVHEANNSTAKVNIKSSDKKIERLRQLIHEIKEKAKPSTNPGLIIFAVLVNKEM